MKGAIAQDMLCLGESYNVCYTSEFMNVEAFVKNEWYRYADFRNIGGILGIGYNNGTGSAFWDNSGAMAPYFQSN